MIETKNLSFIYREEDMESGEIKEEKVLKDINIEIEKGSFTAVLGHNGSGKSTLAKHFNAILLPSGGKVSRQVWFSKIPITKWLRHWLRTRWRLHPKI